MLEDFYSNVRGGGRRWGMRGFQVPYLIFFVLLIQPVFAGLTWDTAYREVRVPGNQREVLADFGFKNETGSPLVISSIQTSCGCTVAKVDRKEVAPGESAAVHVRFDVGSRKGEQVKSIIVRTSDRVSQSLILKVLVQETIAFSQKEFTWSAGAPATTKDSIVEVDPASGAQLLGVESLNDQFEARLEEIEAGRRYRLLVSPRSTQTPVTGSLKVLVADPKKRSIFLQTRIEND